MRRQAGRRAQLFSVDLVISAAVFTLLVLALATVWNVHVARLADRAVASQLAGEAFRITEVLVRSEGVPANWYLAPGNASSLGVLGSDGRAMQAKLAALFSADLSRAWNIERRAWSLVVEDIDGGVVGNVSQGVFQAPIVVVQRLVTTDAQTYRLTLSVGDVS